MSGQEMHVNAFTKILFHKFNISLRISATKVDIENFMVLYHNEMPKIKVLIWLCNIVVRKLVLLKMKYNKDHI